MTARVRPCKCPNVDKTSSRGHGHGLAEWLYRDPQSATRMITPGCPLWDQVPSLPLFTDRLCGTLLERSPKKTVKDLPGIAVPCICPAVVVVFEDLADEPQPAAAALSSAAPSMTALFVARVRILVALDRVVWARGRAPGLSRRARVAACPSRAISV